MQRPGAEAALEKRIAELCFARRPIREISERAVKRLQPIRQARVHHLADRVVPQILLIMRARRPVRRRIGENAIIGMPAADPRRLHAARSRQICRPEAHAVHARRGGRDGLDVLHAFGGFQDRMD